MDESLVHAVMAQYAFRVYEWRWLASDFCRLQTDAGPKMLRVEPDAATTAWRGEVLDALAYQRFRRTPRMIRTRYGDALVTMRDQVCTVTDDWAHRPVGHTHAERISAIENLALLHAAFSRLAHVRHLQPQGRRAAPALLARLDEAKRMLHEAATQTEQTPFSLAYQTRARSVLERAGRAQSTLREAGGLWRDQRAECHHLTLGGYHAGMLAWTDLGHLATIDFDHVVWGDPDWDLFVFSRQLYEHGEAHQIRDLAGAYDQLAQPDPDRMQRLIGFVGFPFATARVVGEYLRSQNRQDERFERELARAWSLDFPSDRNTASDQSSDCRSS